MKKLLLTGLVITSLIAMKAYAQPVAQDATISVDATPIRSTLIPYVKDGQPPYSFAIYGETPDEGFSSYNTNEISALLKSNGIFDFATVAGEGTYHFQYIVTDFNGQTSQPATVTIIVGPIKG